MRKILLLLCFSLFAFGDINRTIINNINEKISNLDTVIGASIWDVRYENFIKYQDINDELIILNLELKKIEDVHLQDELKRKIATLEEQLNVLKEYKELNFAHSLSAPEDIETLSKLTNPFAIIGAFSHIKKLRGEKEEYAFTFNDFKNLVEKIREKNLELKELVNLESNIENIEALKASDKKLEEFDQALKFASVSYSVYEKKIDDEIARVSAEIKAQGLRAINIVIAIVIVVAIAFMLKLVDTATKIINFINLNIIFLILLFAYIENITYLVTILGFASAGLAIAMKDMFMSMLGWCVIVFGGSLRVGDRVKVFQNDTTYVGDIIDISFLRITLYEDIKLCFYKSYF